jgi:hypothetical protein
MGARKSASFDGDLPVIPTGPDMSARAPLPETALQDIVRARLMARAAPIDHRSIERTGSCEGHRLDIPDPDMTFQAED